MAAPTPTEPAKSALHAELPLTDLTLRAGLDGETVRVHRGVLGLHSRILLNALTTSNPPPEELPLPGKSISDLRLLTAFMYPRRSRDESFSVDCITRVCELGREYDMPELLAAADDWLAAHAAELVLPQTVTPTVPAFKEKASQSLKLLQLAHDFQFTRFFELVIASWASSPSKALVLKECANVAQQLDSKVLLRLLSSAVSQIPSVTGNRRCHYCSSAY